MNLIFYDYVIKMIFSKEKETDHKNHAGNKYIKYYKYYIIIIFMDTQKVLSYKER